MNIKLREELQALKSEFDIISSKRKEKINGLSQVICSSLKKEKEIKLVFICTHNSRRSIISQLMMSAAADFYDLKINCFSAGTEVTAFHPNAIQAINTIGFDTYEQSPSHNPIYNVSWSDRPNDLMTVFSKSLSDKSLPKNSFIAVMVCDSADETCPTILLGSDHRITLSYIDPKTSDNSDQAEEVYLNTVKSIGREMLYTLHLVKNNIQF